MNLENPQEYVGKRYGSVVVLKYDGRHYDNSIQFTCKCDCGSNFITIMREPNKIRTFCYGCMPSKHLVDYYNKTIQLSELAKKLKVSRQLLSYRIKHWDISRWAEPTRRKL